MNKITVDEFILNSGKWEESLIMLRELLQSSGMEETVKWGQPVYSLNGKNVAGLCAFKSYSGIWFYQGVFLKDREMKLYKSEDSTRALRQWRFENASEVRDNLELIAGYIEEAMENARQGKEIKPVKKKPFTVPAELQEALDNDENLKQCFNMLSHSKRRDYALYIEQAKRSETREKRLQKSIPMIREGKGFMDQYKNTSRREHNLS
ncbi:MAG: YdeI/OmpD-associated family protein [Bacteroidales bacterium]